MPRVLLLLSLSLLFSLPAVQAQDEIPPIAWRVPIGQPPANPGRNKPELDNIDDGYWQGAPVGGFGAGTFSRSYRGNFERWHLQGRRSQVSRRSGQPVLRVAQEEGGEPVAIVLSTGKPEDHALSAWNWNYPAGGGEYAALYPKILVRLQNAATPRSSSPSNSFRPCCPTTTRNPVIRSPSITGMRRIPRDKPITVSIMFSWTNMVGWFRDQTRDFRRRAK